MNECWCNKYNTVLLHTANKLEKTQNCKLQDRDLWNSNTLSQKVAQILCPDKSNSFQITCLRYLELKKLFLMTTLAYDRSNAKLFA